MMKKILLASAIAAVTSSVAVAHTAPYVGASVGIVNNTQNVKTNGTNSTGGFYRGVPVNLFAGYGGVVGQNFYLAAELNGTVGTMNISDDNNMKSSYGLGASIVPGLMLNDRTLAFARAGVVRTQFSGSGNSSRTGGQFGFGMQTSLTQCVDVRGEYDFVAYQSKNQTSGGVTSSVAPRSDQFSLGLVYKLD